MSWPTHTWKVTHIYHEEDKKRVKEMRKFEHDVGGPACRCDARIITIEDPFKKYEFEQLAIGDHEEDTHVFCIRSFWNNVASRMKLRNRHSAAWHKDFPYWWLELSSAYLDAQYPWVMINYDKWDSDTRYRRQLMRIMSLDPTFEINANMKAYNTAHKGYAGNVGSSFHKWENRGDVTKRWELMMGDKRFRELVSSTDDDVERCRELNLRIFGWTLGHECQLIRS